MISRLNKSRSLFMYKQFTNIKNYDPVVLKSVQNYVD